MQDAEAIHPTSEVTAGIGAAFDCETRVGPFRTTDRMVVTEWEEGRMIAIRHRGLITGTGRFTADADGASRTRFRWDEELRFPWWLGGAVGSAVAAPLLRQIWRGNLWRLRTLIEREPPGT